MELAILAGLSILVLVLLLFIVQLRSQVGSLRDALFQINSNAELVEKSQENTRSLLREEIARNREEMSSMGKGIREEVGGSLKGLQEVLVTGMGQISTGQKSQLDSFANQLNGFTQTTDQKLENMRTAIDGKLQTMREATGKELNLMSDSMASRLTGMAELQQKQLGEFSQQIGNLTASNEKKMEQMRETIENRVKELQANNAQKLEEMRVVVDEKLHATLEQRLGESFKLVSERLEQVHKGLGEMQSLAAGVGDLKKVLTNVKTRGTWGEVQLGNILEDILAPDQYSANVAVKKNSERVEYAIKLPGPDSEGDGLWLPIDAKFPMEDYYRLIEAYELGDAALIEQAVKVLELRIRTKAKEISSKYIEPPATTDFAIMFLPTEGLYAEVLRRPGLFESLRLEHRVSVAGPTTLAAIVSSLSVGFRTLAIQKRSSEVWAVLGAVKTEFGKFGAVLEKTQKKLQEASHTIDEAARRSRAMERRLRTVEALPETEAVAMLGGATLDDDEAAAVQDIE
ncbi:MAG: DNA recombination protein RmuC [Syntrophomonadaceae bacterium]